MKTRQPVKTPQGIAKRSRLPRHVHVAVDPARPANVLAQIMMIVEKHVADVALLQKRGEQLSLSDMKSLDLASAVATRVSKEARQLEKEDDPGELNNTELIAAAEESLRRLRGESDE